MCSDMGTTLNVSEDHAGIPALAACKEGCSGPLDDVDGYAALPWYHTKLCLTVLRPARQRRSAGARPGGDTGDGDGRRHVQAAAAPAVERANERRDGTDENGAASRRQLRRARAREIGRAHV